MHCSIYFPHAEEHELDNGGKAGDDHVKAGDDGKASEEAKTVADAPETTTQGVQDPSSTGEPERSPKQDNASNKQPEEEPEAKRIKSSHDPAEAGEAGETPAKDEVSDEDWQKIEREAVPHKVTIEDVVDESETAATMV